MTLKLLDNPSPCFPEDLFLKSYSFPSWLVVRTKPRHEKVLALELNRHRIGYYLPLTLQPQKSRNRLRFSMMPLFAGYLFLMGTPLDRQTALQTGHILQTIQVIDQKSLQTQLCSIFRAICVQSVKLCDFAVIGKRARVIAGPLTGVEGIVLRTKHQSRLIIQVQIIQQAIQVEIAWNQIQLL